MAAPTATRWTRTRGRGAGRAAGPARLTPLFQMGPGGMSDHGADGGKQVMEHYGATLSDDELEMLLDHVSNGLGNEVEVRAFGIVREKYAALRAEVERLRLVIDQITSGISSREDAEMEAARVDVHQVLFGQREMPERNMSGGVWGPWERIEAATRAYREAQQASRFRKEQWENMAARLSEYERAPLDAIERLTDDAETALKAADDLRSIEANMTVVRNWLRALRGSDG